MKLLYAVAFALFPWAATAQTLKTVKDRGMLSCGVGQGLPGFSAPDDKGNWTGLDVDVCRACCSCARSSIGAGRPSMDAAASAPGGADSSATFTSGGADLKESSEKDEQPARPAPVTAIAMTRRMTNHSDLRQSATIPSGEP